MDDSWAIHGLFSDTETTNERPAGQQRDIRRRWGDGKATRQGLVGVKTERLDES